MPAEKVLVRPPIGLSARMLSEYLDRCLAALLAAKMAADRSDYGGTRVIGHRLKGTGAAYGVAGLTEIGTLIEDASRREDTDEVRRQVAALETYLSRIEVAPD